MQNCDHERAHVYRLQRFLNIVLLFLTFVVVVLGAARLLIFKIENLGKELKATRTELIAAKKNLDQLQKNYDQVARILKPANSEPLGPFEIKIQAQDPALGSAEAKVIFVEFADFQCPFCKSAFLNLLPKLKEKYVDTGKVKFYFKDFAFLGEESTWAAEAAKCASDQNKFWQFHDYLYKSQKGENQGAFSIVNLKKMASSLALDTKKFNSCIDTHKYAGLVAKETESARENYGINGTPTFFVNGKGFVGAQPWEVFQKEIDQALAN